MSDFTVRTSWCQILLRVPAAASSCCKGQILLSRPTLLDSAVTVSRCQTLLSGRQLRSDSAVRSSCYQIQLSGPAAIRFSCQVQLLSDSAVRSSCYQIQLSGPAAIRFRCQVQLLSDSAVRSSCYQIQLSGPTVVNFCCQNHLLSDSAVTATYCQI
jgi:hypothetical protein